MTRRAAIVSPLRTPVGRFLGTLAPLPAERLAAHAITAVVERSGIDAERIEDVVFAQSYANSEAPCIGRWAALAAGLPISIPGMQLDRRCGGGLQSIATAAMMIQSGTADVVLAGGVESMSNIEYYTTAMRGGARAGNVQLYDRLDRGRERSQPVERFGVISSMIETAENLAGKYDIGREESDSFAMRSQQRANAAWEEGRFDAGEPSDGANVGTEACEVLLHGEAASAVGLASNASQARGGACAEAADHGTERRIWALEERVGRACLDTAALGHA